MTDSGSSSSKTSDESRKTLADKLEPWTWRVAGVVVWAWLGDALSLKLSGSVVVGTPNAFLVAVAIPYLWCLLIQRKPWRTLLLSIYLAFFPAVALLLLLLYVAETMLLAGRLLVVLYKLLRIITGPAGTLALLLVFTGIQVLMVKVHYPSLQVWFAGLSLVVTISLVISLLKYVHEPLKPLRRVGRWIETAIAQAAENYCRVTVQDPIRRQDPGELSRASKDLERLEGLLKAATASKRVPSRISGRRVAVPAFVFALLSIIAAVVVGFGGAYYCLNRFSSPSYELFSALPPDASYWESVFFSFSVVTTTQQLMLDQSAVAGRWLAVVEILSSVVVLTICVSVFFTSIGREDEPVLDVESLIKRAEDRVGVWRVDVDRALRIAKGLLLGE